MRSRWAGRVIGVAVVAAVVSAIGTGPASAAKAPDPCKLLKASEIAAAFDGATVSAPEPGLKTAVTTSCGWEVDAGATLPAGGVTATVMTAGAKPAYDGLKKMGGQYAPVAGVKNSLYQESTGALSVLDGDKLVTVQGVFLTPPPIDQVDVLEQLIPLSKLATKRV